MEQTDPPTNVGSTVGLGAETLADMLVFGGFTTRDAADGFGPAQTQTKINYLAALISKYFAEQREQAPNDRIDLPRSGQVE